VLVVWEAIRRKGGSLGGFYIFNPYYYYYYYYYFALRGSFCIVNSISFTAKDADGTSVKFHLKIDENPRHMS